VHARQSGVVDHFALDEWHALSIARQIVTALLAAASAQVAAIDAVYPSFRDSDGLAVECAEARRDGFAAKMAIHPDQVPVINSAFTPAKESIAWAHRVVAALAGSRAGVLVMDGEMIDQPHLKRARRILGVQRS
jgi:citrate lyase subunit beta / citryl-CoA lyase